MSGRKKTVGDRKVEILKKFENHCSNPFHLGKPSCEGGVWTNYISSDVPAGQGDYETLSKVRLIDPSVCENPTRVDARRIKDSLHWTEIGRGEIFLHGFLCKNYVTYSLFNNVSYLPCDDYEVRFCCPTCK